MAKKVIRRERRETAHGRREVPQPFRASNKGVSLNSLRDCSPHSLCRLGSRGKKLSWTQKEMPNLSPLLVGYLRFDSLEATRSLAHFRTAHAQPRGRFCFRDGWHDGSFARYLFTNLKDLRHFSKPTISVIFTTSLLFFCRTDTTQRELLPMASAER